MSTATMKETKASMHSIERSKERVGLNRKRAGRQIELAYQRGKRATDYSRSKDREFLERKSCKDHTEAVAYNGYCYIFDTNNKVCITVFPLPSKFDKKINKASRKERRCSSQELAYEF